MVLPPGWTDDMNIALPGHRSLEEVVTFVILRCMEGTDYDRVQLSLIEEIGLSPDDAALAWDRVTAALCVLPLDAWKTAQIGQGILWHG